MVLLDGRILLGLEIRKGLEKEMVIMRGENLYRINLEL
jgi:hypothetical protein